MNEYYYLNARNVPQGPHSLAELAELMTSGRVNPTTLVACKGGTSWEPLGSVLSRENIDAPEVSLTPGQVGNCPTCQRSLEQDVQAGQLPVRCLNCGRALRPEKAGIWANFCLALRNYFKFSGRATRAEYWSFQLVNFLICMGFLAVLTVCFFIMMGALLQQGDSGSLAQALENEQELDALVETMLANNGITLAITSIILLLTYLLIILWTLFTFIPNISVMVRRLHDAGWSGLWVLAYLCMCLIAPALLIPLEIASANGSVSATTLLGFFGLIYTAIYGFAIFLFVLTLIDSQRGANAYGPSRKYPLG